MKVIFLSAANSIHTVRWANGLVEHGVEVHLIYNKDHFPRINKLNDSVKTYQMHFSNRLGYYLNVMELKKIYDDIKPDLVNVHYASGYGTLARLAKLKNVVLSVWGSDIYDFPYRNKICRLILKKNLKYATIITSTSQCMAQKIKQILCDNVDIPVIPFGIDLRNYSFEKKLGRSRNKIIIGNCKSLEKIYGINVLIEAIAVVVKTLNLSNKNIEVHIFGDGTEKENLKTLIRNLNLNKIVSLMGEISNEQIPQVLNSFDIFCCTSLRESFGVSIVEALAAGVPIIASNIEAFREILENGKLGILVEENNIEALANLIIMLILDKKLIDNYVNIGIEKVKNQYDFSENLKEMINVYTLVQERLEPI